MTGQADSKTTGRTPKTILRRLPRMRNDRMGVSTREGVTILRYTEILYCEAMGNYCRIYLRDQRSLVISKPLKRLSSVLPQQEFVRTHQSYLVRFDEIATVGQDVELINGKILPVSRGQRDTLMSLVRKQLPIV